MIKATLRTILVLIALLVSIMATAAQDINVPVPDIPGGQSVTITYEVRVNDNLPSNVTRVKNQGVVSGSNFANVSTDDPRTTPGGDETVTLLGFNLSVNELPTTGETPFWYIPLISTLLAGLGTLGYYLTMRWRMS